MSQVGIPNYPDVNIRMDELRITLLSLPALFPLRSNSLCERSEE